MMINMDKFFAHIQLEDEVQRIKDIEIPKGTNPKAFLQEAQNKLERGMVISVNLDPTKGSETGKIRPCIIVTNNVYNLRVPVIQVIPITTWSEKKAMISTNIEIFPNSSNGLTKKSIADCLQTRPIDHRQRLQRIIGKIDFQTMQKIDKGLRIVFALDK